MQERNTWARRSPERANLFNPAFCGALIYEFVKTFEKERAEGVPLTYIPVALSMVLHENTRDRLPGSSVSSFLEWVQRNEDLLISFDIRTSNLVPIVKEALRFLLQNDAIRIGTGHLIVLGDKNAHFTAPFLRNTTNEISDIVKKTKFMSRWFVKSGSEISILSTLGVRP